MSLPENFKDTLKLRLRSEAEAVKNEKVQRLEKEYNTMREALRNRYEKIIDNFVSKLS